MVDAFVAMARLVVVVSAVPYTAVEVAVLTTVDVVVGRGGGMSNFWDSSYGRGTGAITAPIIQHILN